MKSAKIVFFSPRDETAPEPVEEGNKSGKSKALLYPDDWPANELGGVCEGGYDSARCTGKSEIDSGCGLLCNVCFNRLNE